LLQHLNEYLLLLGVPGLLAIAFLDSAAVPIMGGSDAVVLLLAWQRPMQVLPIILAAAVGSMLGCLVLYKVGRAGGEKGLARFSAERRVRVKQKLDRNAFVAVMAGVAAPPPFPTKLVILAAGAFGVRRMKFVNGVLVGRLLRYSVLAYVGARFGNQAAGMLKEHYPAFALLLVAASILYVLVRHFRSHEKAPDSGK
jgi:membrane protein YqaA with SNARE-associated domain